MPPTFCIGLLMHYKPISIGPNLHRRLFTQGVATQALAKALQARGDGLRAGAVQQDGLQSRHLRRWRVVVVVVLVCVCVCVCACVCVCVHHLVVP